MASGLQNQKNSPQKILFLLVRSGENFEICELNLEQNEKFVNCQLF